MSTIGLVERMGILLNRLLRLLQPYTLFRVYDFEKIWKFFKKAQKQPVEAFYKKKCSCNFIKIESSTQAFSCEFCEKFKNPFFIEHLLWLLLSNGECFRKTWRIFSGIFPGLVRLILLIQTSSWCSDLQSLIIVTRKSDDLIVLQVLVN